jgi:hypothetical protein
MRRFITGPWVTAVAAALGITLLVPSALALFAPPRWIEFAAQFDDRSLAIALLAFFVLAAATVRLGLPAARSLEEAVAVPVQAPTPRTYLR